MKVCSILKQTVEFQAIQRSLPCRFHPEPKENDGIPLLIRALYHGT
jgi:hypothetical protein